MRARRFPFRASIGGPPIAADRWRRALCPIAGGGRRGRGRHVHTPGPVSGGGFPQSTAAIRRPPCFLLSPARAIMLIALTPATVCERARERERERESTKSQRYTISASYIPYPRRCIAVACVAGSHAGITASPRHSGTCSSLARGGTHAPARPPARPSFPRPCSMGARVLSNGLGHRLRMQASTNRNPARRVHAECTPHARSGSGSTLGPPHPASFARRHPVLEVRATHRNPSRRPPPPTHRTRLHAVFRPVGAARRVNPPAATTATVSPPPDSARYDHGCLGGRPLPAR